VGAPAPDIAGILIELSEIWRLQLIVPLTVRLLLELIPFEVRTPLELIVPLTVRLLLELIPFEVRTPLELIVPLTVRLLLELIPFEVRTPLELIVPLTVNVAGRVVYGVASVVMLNVLTPTFLPK